MKLRIPLMALVFVCVGISLGWGATTGKITGVITDAATGEPVVGVSVLVVGTNLGAQTDADGRYTIINVPVDTYTLRISSVGYSTLEVSNVAVSVDLTTYQSHTLSQQTTDIGQTIRVVAERPLVMEDKTTSVNIVTRDQLLAMPTRGFEQVVGIQNSVVRMNSNADIRQRGFREATATAPEINLRGGRPSEVAYYVDGFSQQDPLTGISTANINNNAIKEVSVTSGAFSAEYGHVASGIVQVTTNSGTKDYHGNIEVVTDQLAGQLGYDAFDQNYYSADLAGPIPGMKDAFFFVSGERRWLGDRQPSIKTYDIYTDFGLADKMDNPWRKPNNELGGWSYQGKLDFNLTPNFKLELSGNGSIDRWQQYTHSYLNPDFLEQITYSPRYKDENLGINAKVTHTLSSKAFYNLSGSYYYTSRQRGDGILFDNYAAYNRGFANPEVDQYSLFAEGDIVWAADVDTTDALEPGDPGDVVLSYAPHLFDDWFDRRSSYIGFKGDINYQITSANTIKAGFDLQRHTLRYFRDYIPTYTQGFNPENVNYYGFDSTGNTTNGGNFTNKVKHPINLGLYVQDRFEYRGLIVNGGLRFDYFDYKTDRVKNLRDPLDPNNTGNDVMDPGDLEPSEKFYRVSPRVGVSFPISDKSQMHVNYGVFYQRPDLNNLYVNYDFFAARISAGSYLPFSNPNLKPETITQYEIGLTRQLGEVTSFDVTAYYKDVKDLTQIVTIYGSPLSDYQYPVYANQDFGTIKGVDFSLDMRRNHNISMSLKYSLSYADGTGSYTQSQYNIGWKNPDGSPRQTHPLDYDQRHSLIGMFDLRTVKGEGPKLGDMYVLENTGLNVLVQLASGTPYTPTRIYDAITTASVTQEPTGEINSEHMPWTFTVDFKLERTFDFGRYQLVPYLWVRNLLDHENVLSVYEGTGEAGKTGYLTSTEGQAKSTDATELPHYHTTEGAQYAYRYDLLQNNPSNYSYPRMIMVGLRMSF